MITLRHIRADLLPKVELPEGQRGEWHIQRFVVDEAGADAHNKYAWRDALMSKGPSRLIVPGTYTGLWRGDTLVMSDTPAEMEDHLPMIRAATERILIMGLGLGLVLSVCLDLPSVEHATVVELSEDVIALVGAYYEKRYGPRLSIIQADALTWEPPKEIHFGAVWHDIWDVAGPENLPTMYLLRQKYRHRATWQGCWCYQECVRMAAAERGTHKPSLAQRLITTPKKGGG